MLLAFILPHFQYYLNHQNFVLIFFPRFFCYFMEYYHFLENLLLLTKNEIGRYKAMEYKTQLQPDYIHKLYQAPEKLLSDPHQRKELILN
jgi:hypothetical protein